MKKFNLTPRQKQVAILVSSGTAQKTIADKLGISIHTVRAHISTIKLKIGTSTVFEAISVLSRYF